MGMAWTKRLTASAIVSLLVAAGAAHAQDAVPPPPQAPAADASAYLTQHFSFDALTPDVQAAITQAKLAPVPFTKITLHTSDTVTSPDHQQPSKFSTAMTLENAGHGLVRRIEAVQDDKGNTVATQLELTYRGYLPFLTQGIPPQANTIPPVQAARKLLRFDTGSSGHFAFVYLYGMTGGQTFQDPGQFLCDSGKSYSASRLNPSIDGQAIELNCRVIDTNGIETDKVTLAYLDKYAVAVTLRSHNQQRTVDSIITDFQIH
ncbi:hypothetical protein GCM10010981_08770 [Dyella nitratireducens]|uniref:Uncharacterized protein n=2 Tax=Dyella nitratireducens TaxID=1849580 RepID=A0ABQ1FN01_9GAMM|nr:hypothetical protein GCM10010981_08770 [Dyella nitratireducens]GLQ44063.1 hypothetical protein GCM10007902_39130 [Dyella nitratireducens]